MATEVSTVNQTQQGTEVPVEDSVITAQVKALFLDEPNLSYDQINVETFKGVVHLSGFVGSRIDIKRAVEIALGVNGVNSVENQIKRK